MLRKSSHSASSYCLNLVRKRDYERYLATLLLPHRVRRAAFAVRALNVELASVKESVSQIVIGKMRMKFWRDAFADENKVPDHPVAKEVVVAVRGHDLGQDLLLKMIDARESRLEEKAFDSLDAVDDHSRATFGAVNVLIAECLKEDGAKLNGHVRHCANQLGQAEGLVTLIRSLPFHAAQKRCLYPTELLIQSGVFDVNQDKSELKTVTEMVAARAQDRLENCRFRAKYLNADEKAAMLPAVNVDAFLDRLSRVKCDVFDPKATQSLPWLPFLLLKHKLKRSY